MKTPDQDIREIEELEDGSTVYEVGPPKKEQIDNDSFYDNLASTFPESARSKLSTFLLEAIEQDTEARQDWLDSVLKVKQYLGFSLEDLHEAPFKQSSRTFDTTLSTQQIQI